jgi:hypothetical protein
VYYYFFFSLQILKIYVHGLLSLIVFHCDTCSLKKKKCFPCMLHKANILTYFEFVFYLKKNKYSKFKIKCVLAWIS